MKIARINGIIACCTITATVEQGSALPEREAPLTSEEIRSLRKLTAEMASGQVEAVMEDVEPCAVTSVQTPKGNITKIRVRQKKGSKPITVLNEFGEDGTLSTKFSEGALKLASKEQWRHEQHCQGERPSNRQILNKLIAEEVKGFRDIGIKTYRAEVTKDGRGCRIWLAPSGWRKVIKSAREYFG